MANWRPRVLVLAKTYPNDALPTLGLWTRRLVRASLPFAEPVVVAPVPYAPPGPLDERYSRYRRIPRVREDDGVTVHHPRVPAGPGNLLLSLDSYLAYPAVRRLVSRLHRERSFDLIHAHFIYPEGVIAARLGRRLSIPVVSTEHTIWAPALERYPRIRRQIARALPHIRMVTAVSGATRASFLTAFGDSVPVEMLPNVVDEEVFRGPTGSEPWDRDLLLFVGLIRRVKGLDVLVRAMAQLRASRPATRLKVIGSTFYRGQEQDWREVRKLVQELDLESRVEFAGETGPSQVAAAMRASAVVVVPSRREAFSAVVVEALASGTPVVATRSGGPEEIITDQVGRLVAPEDPVALAAALEEVLRRRPEFDRAALREYAISRYGTSAVGARIAEIYRMVLS